MIRSSPCRALGAPLLAAPLLAASLLAAPLAQAQAVYRSVGPDGRAIFSDVPPKEAAANASRPGAAPPASASLPYALRDVVQRFPVVLYTGPDCAPCERGRMLLAERGVPFSERTVASEADAQSLQRLSGERSLPLLTIGAQHLKGFSDVQWQQYLDAAGYPKSSMLPTSWKREAPQPLAPRTAARAAASGAPTDAAAAPSDAGAAPSPTPATPAAPAAEGASRSNPAGIQF